MYISYASIPRVSLSYSYLVFWYEMNNIEWEEKEKKRESESVS